MEFLSRHLVLKWEVWVIGVRCFLKFLSAFFAKMRTFFAKIYHFFVKMYHFFGFFRECFLRFATKFIAYLDIFSHEFHEYLWHKFTLRN